MLTKKETIKITHEFDAIVLKDQPIPRLQITNEEWYYAELNKFNHEENVSLKIGQYKNKRTEKQNRYYWGVYLPKIIKEGVGQDNKDILHDIFKEEFLTIEVVEVFNPITKIHEKRRIYKSTTKLTTGEFSKFIKDIETTTGVIAPPTENYGLQPLELYMSNPQ